MSFYSTKDVVRLTGRFVWGCALAFVLSLFVSGSLVFVIPAVIVAVAWAERGARAKGADLCQKCREQR